MKKYGLLENSSRGVWVFTQDGAGTTQVDPNDVVSRVRALESGSDSVSDTSLETEMQNQNDHEPHDDEELDLETSWKGELMDVLLQMDASVFERLIIPVLRESGFDDVKVTGKSGDGGIDGKGIVRINGILSFHAIVQCKRYRPDRLINASDIRDFRGAMTGRTDKGIFITTSSFTRAVVWRSHPRWCSSVAPHQWRETCRNS